MANKQLLDLPNVLYQSRWHNNVGSAEMFLSLWVDQFPNLLWGQQAEKHLKQKCEPRVVLPNVSAFYNLSIRHLLVSCREISVLLWVRCVCISPVLGQDFYVYLENAYSVEEENSLCAKLEDSVDVMLSILKSGLGFMSWYLQTHQILALYSQTCDVLFLMRNQIFPILGCFSKPPRILSMCCIRLSHWNPPSLPRILLPQTQLPWYESHRNKTLPPARRARPHSV